jgi:membrane associated rhomboid family serine protease
MLPLRDDQTHRRTPYVTATLIAANVAVFLYEVLLWLDGPRQLNGFIDQHALQPSRLVQNLGSGDQWLTVLSSMFLHASPPHVLGNCWFLWVFGNNIEDKLGPLRFFFFYLLCGAGAAFLQVIAYPAGTIPMVGASGAISGVLGAYLFLFPFAWIWTLVPWIVPILPLPAFVFLVLWFAVQMTNGVGSLMSGEIAHGGVAWWAHAGGFASGFALILVARKYRWIKKR